MSSSLKCIILNSKVFLISKYIFSFQEKLVIIAEQQNLSNNVLVTGKIQ